jgi:dTDP-4-dehydrorhamnose reductase
MKNVIIFGSTGMLGNYVYSIFSNENKYNIICINRKDFDVMIDEWSKLNKILKDILKKDDVIINCIGSIPQKNDINKDYEIFIKTNTLFPHKLSELSNKYDCKLIHITTDCIFDGTKGNYTINDSNSAKDVYGISKYLGEPSDVTIIRTSIIGEENTGKKSLLEWVKSNKNGSINGFIDHYWNGITCLTLAKIIKKIVDEDLYWTGVKHIFSPNIVSKYDLCLYINEIYELNIEIIPFKTNKKYMTLSGEINFEIDNIYEQIKELKTFTK